MYDPTIHVKTLSRHLQAQDFYDDPQLFNSTYKTATLNRAVAYACNGFPVASLKRNKLRSKYIYGFTDLAEALVIRHITRSIRRVTAVKQDDRAFIVKCIRTLTSEGLPFSVYKFDVAKFYESIDVSSIIKRLTEDIAFSGQSVRALDSFFTQLLAAGIVGLPRGLALSATLAEYLMRDFDHLLSNTEGVWYYARFVDDILIITDDKSNPAEFLEKASTALPTGLSFNRHKTRSYPLAPFKKGNAADLEVSFDFLGYRFDVSKAFRNGSNRVIRTTTVDISDSKAKKIKSRVAAAFLAYKADHNFVNLRDRLRVLTANVVYVDQRTGVRRPSGLLFNYPLMDGSNSLNIPKLDQFLRHSIVTPHPKNKLFSQNMTLMQRRELAGLTFTHGVANRRFFHIPFKRLLALTSVWSYV